MKINALCHSLNLPVPSFLKKKNRESVGSENFKIERVLQDGKHSQILLSKNKEGEIVILKKLNTKYIREELIDNEIAAGKALSRHCGIAKLNSHFLEGDFVFLVLEYVPGVDLFDYLQMHGFKSLRELEAKIIFKQIVSTTLYIHKKGFVHRDLKLENVMLMKNSKIKIIDFGLCANSDCNSTLNSFLGSVEYACPEILARRPYHACKAEVWSLGVLLFALLHGQFPFSAFDREKKFEFDLCFPVEVTISTIAKDLISNMLIVNSEKRYTMKDVANHPWLKS